MYDQTNDDKTWPMEVDRYRKCILVARNSLHIWWSNPDPRIEIQETIYSWQVKERAAFDQQSWRDESSDSINAVHTLHHNSIIEYLREHDPHLITRNGKKIPN